MSFAALAALLALALAAPIALVVAPFWMASCAVRRLSRRLEPPTVGWQRIIAYAPDVGWKPLPNLDAWANDFIGDAFRLTTDESGWRGRGTVADADVVVFGDSFAFGFAVDDEAYYAHVADGPRVKAVGAPGYDMVQGLYWIEQYAPALRDKLVVWMLYPANDLEDNLHPYMDRYRAPFLRSDSDDEWEIETTHVRPEPWPFPTRRPNYETFIEICSPTYTSERVFAACAHLIDRAAEVCAAADAELLVLSVPDLSAMSRRVTSRALATRPDPEAFDPDRPDREIARICERSGVRFVALGDHLDESDYLIDDVHWNAQGHRRVADLLRKLWEDREHASAPPIRPRPRQPVTAAH